MVMLSYVPEQAAHGGTHGVEVARFQRVKDVLKILENELWALGRMTVIDQRLDTLKIEVDKLRDLAHLGKLREPVMEIPAVDDGVLGFKHSQVSQVCDIVVGSTGDHKGGGVAFERLAVVDQFAE